MALLSKQNETYLLIGGAVIAGFVFYKASKAAKTVKEVVTTDLNPAHEDNVVNEAIGKPLARFISGGEHDNLGSWFYCVVNPDAIVCNPEKAATAQALDVSYKTEQTDMLYEQEADFYNTSEW